MQPDPQAALPDVEHREHANDQQHGPQVDQVFARCPRQLKHAGLHLGEVAELKQYRGRVKRGIRQRQHRLGHEAAGFFSGGQRRQAGLLARDLGQLNQAAVDDAQQHLRDAGALAFGHAGLDKLGQRLQATRLYRITPGFFSGAQRRMLITGKQRQCTLRRQPQLLGHLRLVGGGGLADIAFDGLVAQSGTFQPGMQAVPAVNATGVVHGDAQVAKWLARRIAHAGQKHALAVQLNGQHVVVELACLATAIAQLVADRRAHIAQGFGLVAL